MMKILKKMIIFIIMLLLVVLLTGCGNDIVENKKVEGQQENLNKKSKFDYTIIIDGNKYEFPITYDKFKSMGWKAQYIGDEVEEYQWEPDIQGTLFTGGAGCFTNGKISGMWPMFYNDTKETIKISETKIVGVVFDERNDDYIFPVGLIKVKKSNSSEIITLGESSKEQIIEVFGEPVYDGGDWILYSATDEYDMSNRLSFEFNYENIATYMTFIDN